MENLIFVSKLSICNLESMLNNSEFFANRILHEIEFYNMLPRFLIKPKDRQLAYQECDCWFKNCRDEYIVLQKNRWS